MNALYIILPPLFIIAGYTEVKKRRIPNNLTYAALIVGIAGSFIISGIPGLKMSLTGAGIAALVMLPFCLLGALGGGDLKLMAAVGAIVGYPLILWVLYYSCMAGGAMAVVYMLWSGKFLTTLSRAFSIMLGKRENAVQKQGLKKEIIIPFGLAIAAGTLWTLFF
ncbi:prepilin peptidase [Lentisphaerota bacterium ZTH]|nr:prepilin peptidase [Lentisphaerota bacterium]WET05782.1 prepilin peptidase [Lentisphaerota bacterium ZTH]